MVHTNNKQSIDKSLQFHKKHKEFSDKENIFAAYYNMGITQRFLKKYDDSLKSFDEALQWSIQRMDYESECVTLGQMGLTNLTTRNINGALTNFKAYNMIIIFFRAAMIFARK